MAVFEVNNDTKKKKAVAVRFSNGTLNSRDQHRVSFKCYRPALTTQKTQEDPRLIVTAEVDGLIYMGKNFGSSNRFSTENCDYYLGVHNKKTGKIQVISAQLCQLEPCLEDKKNANEEDLNAATYKEKQYALAKEFGSGRSQRAVKKKMNEKLEEDMVSTTTKSVVESKHTQQQATLSSDLVKTETSAVPPHNKDATCPEDVYKLSDILSPEVLASVGQQSDVFYNSTLDDIVKWREEKKFGSFILSKLEMLSLREDARKLQSQCLMFLHYLMTVFLMKSPQLRSKFPLPKEWPIAVKNHILDTFTLEIDQKGRRNSRCVPARLKDLLLSHIMVLCLKLSQFDLPLTPLMNDLNLSQKRATTHASALGCTIKKSKNSSGQIVHSAVLAIPLKFPVVKGKTQKQRIF